MSPRNPNRVRICSLLTDEDRLVTWTTAVPGIPLIVHSCRTRWQIGPGGVWFNVCFSPPLRAEFHGSSGRTVWRRDPSALRELRAPGGSAHSHSGSTPAVEIFLLKNICSCLLVFINDDKWSYWVINDLLNSLFPCDWSDQSIFLRL